MLKVSDKVIEVRSEREGVIKQIDARIVGEVSMKLGAGRVTQEDIIDPTVGVVLNKIVGDKVSNGELLCTLYVNKIEDEFNIREAFVIE